ncbi:MAG TPA: DUF1839 family protein [Bryobacteraceae bacterium]|nr:DUF1839 family protein [Bryobacteraceae bacterium]
MVTATSVELLQLDPSRYVPSPLHDSQRTFRESNCYVDIWIELLHALGINAASAMAFTCAIDFEGDQWTFIKPPPDELYSLFGIDVHEMQLYRPILDHVVEQLSAGRTIIFEADSFYLPDTASTSYRHSHVKSSIAIEAIDIDSECLRYFHGAGYYELLGEDFRGVFRLGRDFSADVLPPYVELVRIDAGPRLENGELRSMARELLRRHLARRPKNNPWRKFGERLAADLPGLLAGTEDNYHAYAFATVRQCGAAFELARSFVEWLVDPIDSSGQVACRALESQVANAKALLFRLARRRNFDPVSQISQLAEDWEIAQSELESICRSS